MSSYKRIPTLQISTLWSWPDYVSISGAKYSVVPQKVFLIDLLLIKFDQPKSTSFKLPFPSKIKFSGFISLCMTGFFFPWIYLRAKQSCFIYCFTSSSVNLFFLFKRYQSWPPDAYSRTKYMLSWSSKWFMILMIFLWYILYIIFVSILIYFIISCSNNLFLSIYFKA